VLFSSPGQEAAACSAMLLPPCLLQPELIRKFPFRFVATSKRYVLRQSLEDKAMHPPACPCVHLAYQMIICCALCTHHVLHAVLALSGGTDPVRAVKEKEECSLLVPIPPVWYHNYLQSRKCTAAESVRGARAPPNLSAAGILVVLRSGRSTGTAACYRHLCC
jgi:hypothetical protein